MKHPKQAATGIPPDTIFRHDEVDRQLEALLAKIVHDSPYNFKSSEQGDKLVDQSRRGVPRHEW